MFLSVGKLVGQQSRFLSACCEHSRQLSLAGFIKDPVPTPPKPPCARAGWGVVAPQQLRPSLWGWCSLLAMAKQKQPASSPMTLGNMCELGLALILGFHFNAEAGGGGCLSGVLGHAYDFIEIPRL